MLKLLYFNSRGRAEFIRFILAQAAVDYEDCRIPETERPNLKSLTPFGKLPVLEVDGKQLAQSFTIGRYLAKLSGLAGQSSWEEALADQYCDVVRDVYELLVLWWAENDITKKEELKQKLLSEAVPDKLSKLQHILVSSSSEFMVGNKLTWADLVLANFLMDAEPYFTEDIPAIVHRFPGIEDHYKRVLNLPNIAKWLKDRPKTSW